MQNRKLGKEETFLKKVLDQSDIQDEQKKRILDDFSKERKMALEADLLAALNDFFVDADLDFDSVMDSIPEDRIFRVGDTYLTFGDDVERHIQVNFDLDGLKWLNYIDGELVLEEPRDEIQTVIYEIANCRYDDILRACVDEGSKRFGKVKSFYF